MKYLLLILLPFCGFSQDYVQTATKILNAPVKKEVGETVLDVATNFLGKPYVASTLEKTPEGLVFNLDEFDCYTLVENVLALTLTKYNPENGFDTYKEYLQLLRYRDGVIDGYASRIHYFSDWANQAIKGDILTDIGKEVGQRNEKLIDFMSRNRRLYTSIATDNSQWEKIKETENDLNTEGFYFVPKEKVTAVQDKIREGDIIAFTSTVNGLDVNHEGFAVRKDGKLHLLHASLEEKKVIVSPETLQQYLTRIKKHAGIMILRVAR